MPHQAFFWYMETHSVYTTYLIPKQGLAGQLVWQGKRPKEPGEPVSVVVWHGTVAFEWIELQQSHNSQEGLLKIKHLSPMKTKNGWLKML